MEEGYRLAQEIGALNMLAYINACLASICYYPDDLSTAVQSYKKSLVFFEQIGNKLGVAQVLRSIGKTYYLQGHYSEALSYLQKSLSLLLEYGNKAVAASTLYQMGVLALNQEHLSEAKVYFLECLDMLREVEIYDELVASSLVVLSQIIKVGDHSERIATLLGAAEVLKAKTVVISSETENAYNRILDAVQQYLDEDSFSAAYERGLAMSRDEAIAFGLEVGTIPE
jgi:tetratricopeptide (TPR) repeat protein